jgi:hypothetical protein
LSAFTRHTITSPDVLRQRLSVIRLTQMATSRNEFECGKAAIAMPIFYGGGRVAAAIELTVGNLGSELRPATGALSVACRSLSRQLATELHTREAETVTRSPTPRSPRGAHSTDPPDSRSSPEVVLVQGVSRTFMALLTISQHIGCARQSGLLTSRWSERGPGAEWRR